MKTCVSLRCPFQNICKHYNFLVDREPTCEHISEFIQASKYYEARQQLQTIKNELEQESLIQKYLDTDIVKSKQLVSNAISVSNLDDVIDIYVTTSRNVFSKLAQKYLTKYPFLQECDFHKDGYTHSYKLTFYMKSKSYF